jgi:lycopene cyclase domain
MVALAVFYTTPWDALLISKGIWFYGENVVTTSLFGIPLGEYLFFIFQTVGVSLYALYSGFDAKVNSKIFKRYWLAAPFILVSVVGAWMTLSGPQSFFYLGAILGWAGPVISLQWIYGADVLLKNGKKLILAILVPVAYLSAVDSLAINTGLWTIQTSTSLGVNILGLPVEEAIFFLTTSTMVVQGVILYVWTVKSGASKRIKNTLT